MNNFGQEEGEICWRNGCDGIIEVYPRGDCSCHISPPCGECTRPREFCNTCDWNAEDEANAEYLNGFRAIVDKKSEACWAPVKGNWERRPLDPRKIDYHVIATGSGSTQICEGVYPEGMTRDEVRKLVNGTFGGRFDYFADGKFKYTAYTD